MSQAPHSEKLSDYDQGLGVGMPPFFRMFCFSYVPDLERMAASLSHTLARFPRCATRLVSESGEAKLLPLSEPMPLEVRPPLAWTPEQFRRDQFSRFVAGLEPGIDQPLLTATLTPVTTGCVLSMTMSHALGDYFSYFLLLFHWSAQYRSSVPTSELGADGLARLRLASREESRSHEAPAVDSYPSDSGPERQPAVLSFDHEFLESLRSELMTGAVPPSLNDALTAYVLHRYGRKIMGRSHGLRLRIPVSVRGVHPAVPKDFIGNAILEAIVPLDDLVDSPLAASRTAERIRQTVRAVRDPAYVETALSIQHGQVALHARDIPVYDREIDILSTNLSKMKFEHLDFGGGPPTTFFGTHSVYRGMSISASVSGLDVRIFGELEDVNAP
ncbi:MAG: hypothetical protein JWN48_770 [Myxococcaceae bacterium]|nr:hypothetical protein [Myxococcaceae bacterium]